MSCDEFKDQLAELAMGTLDATRQAEVRAHLKSGCPECNSYLAEIRETVAALPLALDPIQPPAMARYRLMTRDRSPTPSMRVVPAPTPSPRRFNIFQALAGGAIAAGIMGVILFRTAQLQRESIASLQSQLDTTRATLDQFQKTMQSRTDLLALNLQHANETILRTSRTVEMMRSPGIQMVSMQGTEAQPKVKARAYWNSEKSMVHFYATDVAEPPAGKTYQFWLLTDKGAALPSGTFAADEVSGGVAIALPTTSDKVVAFAVTEEPMGGSKNPTMPIMMKGAIQ